MRHDESDIEQGLVRAAHAAKRCPEALLTGLLALLSSQKMSIQGMFVGLLQTPSHGKGWPELRTAILAALAAAPEKAPSVLSVARQVDEWGEVVYRVREEGPPHARIFEVAAEVEMSPFTTIKGTSVRAPRKHDAEKRAAVALLAAAVDAPAPAFPRAARAPAPSSASVSKNAVTILYEHAQEHGIAQPRFIDAQDGPPHIPTFTCTCSYHGLSVEKEGGSKREANLAAAEAMIVALRERHAKEVRRGD